MPYLQHILKRLKSYSVSPPAGLFNAITSKIKRSAQLPAPLDNTERKMTSLQKMEVAPPDFLFDNIVKSIKEEKESVQLAEPAKIIPLKRNYLVAAAASVVLLLAALGIYNFLDKQKPANYTAQVNDPLPANTGTGKQDSIATPTNIPAEKVEDIVTAVGTSTQKKRRSPGFTGNNNPSSASVDGYSFPIQDNDLMATFTSFNQSNLPPFLTNDNTDAVKVRVDKSTAITLSADMLDMMKKSYRTKKNGKPTVRAKREKRKFAKWKQADTKFFDKNVEKNPMDPIDLAEFIF